MGCRASVRVADKSFKLGRTVGKRPAHSGEDHEIADLKSYAFAALVAPERETVGEKREHAPIYEVRAVALRRVFTCDVCDSAEYSLAGSRLLACASVAGTARRDESAVSDAAVKLYVGKRGENLRFYVGCLFALKLGIGVDLRGGIPGDLHCSGAENVGAVSVVR